jgi:CHAT domain-containing protein
LTNQQKAGVKRIKFGDLEIENPTKEDVEQLCRQLPQQYEPDETIKAAPSMLRILFLAANPNQTSRLDLEEEIRSIEMELQAVKHREAISMIPCHAVRPDDLVRYVRNVAPNVIHFSGHGSPDGIVLRNDVGGYQTVSGDALRRFFANRGIDLVILNSCVSGDQAKQISTVVPAVVGTSDLVGDEAARRFSISFYRGLGNGLKISEAFRDGGDSVTLHGLSDVFVDYGNLEIALVGEN